jgi:NADH-quinone oxidoreductase subunit I
MSKEYDLTFQARTEAIFGLDRLLVPMERLEDRLQWLARHRNPQFGTYWDYPEHNNIHTLRNRLAYLAEIEAAVAEADEEVAPAAEA